MWFVAGATAAVSHGGCTAGTKVVQSTLHVLRNSSTTLTCFTRASPNTPSLDGVIDVSQLQMDCLAHEASHGTQVASVAAGDASYHNGRPW
jgi:hypothetical protein